jgi:hypothetical protein
MWHKSGQLSFGSHLAQQYSNHGGNRIDFITQKALCTQHPPAVTSRSIRFLIDYRIILYLLQMLNIDQKKIIRKFA